MERNFLKVPAGTALPKKFTETEGTRLLGRYRSEQSLGGKDVDCNDILALRHEWMTKLMRTYRSS